MGVQGGTSLGQGNTYFYSRFGGFRIQAIGRRYAAVLFPFSCKIIVLKCC